METDDGWRVGFVDPRRFGSVDLVETAQEDAHRLLAGMGPEPLDDAFSVSVLETALAGKKTPIKAALLDQKVVAGLGNIYVCESLFRAGISPLRLAGTRPRRPRPAAGAGDQGDADRGDRRRRLDACATMCSRAGNWVISSRHGKSTAGKANPAPDARATPACAGVRRIVQSGRSTFYCPRTQK